VGTTYGGIAFLKFGRAKRHLKFSAFYDNFTLTTNISRMDRDIDKVKMALLTTIASVLSQKIW